MSIAEIERFAADMKSSQALRVESEKAQADTSMVAFAASKGYVFTVDEAKEHAKARAKAAGKELTDAELDGVAGGADAPYLGWLPVAATQDASQAPNKGWNVLY